MRPTAPPAKTATATPNANFSGLIDLPEPKSSAPVIRCGSEGNGAHGLSRRSADRRPSSRSRPSPMQASMKSSILRATVRMSNSASTRLRPARARSARRSGASINPPSAAARPSASFGSTVTAQGPQISARPPSPEVISAAPLASASSAVRPNGSGPVVSTMPTAALLPCRLDLGIGKVRVDPDPAAESFGRVAKRLDGLGLPVAAAVGQHEAGAPSGPRRQSAHDRRHRLDVALAREARPTQRIDLLLGFRSPTRLACRARWGLCAWSARTMGNWPRNRSSASSLTKAKPESGAALGRARPRERARRRLLIGVAVQHRPRAPDASAMNAAAGR